MTNEIIHNGIKLDPKKIQKLLKRIIIRESNNLKTKDKNDGQMEQIIQEMIQEEVECY